MVSRLAHATKLQAINKAVTKLKQLCNTFIIIYKFCMQWLVAFKAYKSGYVPKWPTFFYIFVPFLLAIGIFMKK